MTDKNNGLIIRSNVTGRMFARFAMYDTFIRRKGWRSPLAFFLIMSAFAAVCFAAKGKEQSSLLGLVLLSVGVVLPVIWVLMYIFSVRSQIKKLKLSASKTQYTVELKDSGIHITKGKEAADFKWKSVTMLVDDGECAYLYLDKAKAFILPKNQQWAELVAMAEKKLSHEQIKLKRS